MRRPPIALIPVDVRITNRPPATADFIEALRTGRTVGFVIAATPLRFAGLAGDVATTFVETKAENVCHIFATRRDARLALHRIPTADRLGWIHKVRKVSFFAAGDPPHGPKLDMRGFPFAMQTMIVDPAGETTPWPHGGRFGWRRLVEATQPGSAHPASGNSGRVRGLAR